MKWNESRHTRRGEEGNTWGCDNLFYIAYKFFTFFVALGFIINLFLNLLWCIAFCYIAATSWQVWQIKLEGKRKTCFFLSLYLYLKLAVAEAFYLHFVTFMIVYLSVYCYINAINKTPNSCNLRWQGQRDVWVIYKAGFENYQQRKYALEKPSQWENAMGKAARWHWQSHCNCSSISIYLHSCYCNCNCQSYCYFVSCANNANITYTPRKRDMWAKKA